MKKLWLKTSLALAVGAVSTHSLGNGIAINEQSVSGMGTSFAGRASAVNDASILFGNPAGLSKLERPEVVGGFGLVKANVDIDDASAETHKGDMVPLTPVPFAYYASPIDEKFSWGLGLYVPYALISDYEKSFGGRFKGQYSKVEVVTLQPTLSYQINDRVSVGFGPTINKIKGKLVNKLDNSAALGTGETKVGIKGDDVAYGFNVGLMVDVTDSLTWGLTYHSKVDYTLEGRTRITNGSGPIFSQFNGDYDASLDFTTPETIDTSVTYKLDDQWTLYAGTTFTRWSRLQEIVVENEGTPSLLGMQPIGEVSEELKWHNTWSYAIGASYQLNPQWVLRTGLAIDPSPAENEHRSVRIPVGNRKVFSVGAGWSPNPDLTIDVAYSYLQESSAKVNQASKELAGAEIAPGFSAEYNNSAHGLGLQATYRF
ncbi:MULTISPECIES: outer membrane protein transport protein [Pseudomonadaceae]|jgi:long-chain fatty acid transport protein|uniref:Outer membrane protein transport protein n=1 Tax=Aquipseudomonas alcaligenes TaxID=43263 RepID=A0AB73I0J2_AQUAC|nr:MULTISPECIES: outer membrane protein transport protein [Pseudomonas]MDC7825531.1 outer membrane protein transport protein [Pseudomonas sp. BLCC-B13]MDH0143441.1 outer membrane protein transport protein [Pseudomonas alcaligenes]